MRCPMQLLRGLGFLNVAEEPRHLSRALRHQRQRLQSAGAVRPWSPRREEISVSKRMSSSTSLRGY